jgi:hypothetical protein
LLRSLTARICSKDMNNSSWTEQPAQQDDIFQCTVHNAASQVWNSRNEGANLHAQPFCSSMVGARSDVVLLAAPCLVVWFLTSFASMFTDATSLIMQPILYLDCVSSSRSRVVFPACFHPCRTY